MPSLFRKKSEHADSKSPRSAKESDPKRPKPQKASRSSKSSRKLSEEHPLNLPPEELRRLSALSAMSSPQENGDPMETTPAPEEAPPGAFPTTNGINGKHEHGSDQEGPAPPPHQTPSSPSPQPEVPQVDAEACKAAGNKFYKAGQYQKAIDEYTKGGLYQFVQDLFYMN